MKTFCLFLAVALAYSVGATFIEGLETNRSHTRRHFGTKDESSKQLVPSEQDSSKQVQLIATKADQKTKLKGFAAIALKWGGKCGGALKSAFPATAAAMKTKFEQIKIKTGWAKGKKGYDDWAKANPVKSAGLKFMASTAFAVGDAVVSTLIVAACPPTVAILITDAAIELAKAVFDLAGGTGTDQQTARVAWQGLALVLAIGGIDGEGVPGADASHLAEAMGNFYYGVAGNVAGEFADAMGGNLAPADLTNQAANDKAAAANAAMNTKLGATGTVYTLSNGKKRKVMLGGDTGQAALKAQIDASKV